MFSLSSSGVSGGAASHRTLHFPVLEGIDLVGMRLGGPGLGNSLFPIFRAFEAAHRDGGRLIWPQLFQIKIGPILRRETDWRFYGNLFKLRPLRDIGAHLRIAILRDHLHQENGAEIGLPGGGSRVFLHRGLARYFHSLDAGLVSAFTADVRQRMRRRDQLYGLEQGVDEDDLAVHLRLGDFAATPTNAHRGMNQRTEYSWYVAAIKAHLRERPHSRVRIFTDDQQAAAAGLRGVSGIDFVDRHNALVSLLFMAKHSYLVGSRSSFSLWSAFLGHQRVVFPSEFDISGYGCFEKARALP